LESFGVTVADFSGRDDNAAQAGAETIIYVCTTCRQPHDPDDWPRPGAAFAAATLRAAENTGIAVRPLRCLANCTRGCSAVLRRLDAWSYVFGRLNPATDAAALVQGAQLLSRSADGLMPWRGRPEALKRGLIARVPPFDFQEQSE
jgi:predicted metal-binding protein